MDNHWNDGKANSGGLNNSDTLDIMTK